MRACTSIVATALLLLLLALLAELGPGASAQDFGLDLDAERCNAIHREMGAPQIFR